MLVITEARTWLHMHTVVWSGNMSFLSSTGKERFTSRLNLRLLSLEECLYISGPLVTTSFISSKQRYHRPKPLEAYTFWDQQQSSIFLKHTVWTSHTFSLQSHPTHTRFRLVYISLDLGHNIRIWWICHCILSSTLSSVLSMRMASSRLLNCIEFCSVGSTYQTIYFPKK